MHTRINRDQMKKLLKSIRKRMKKESPHEKTVQSSPVTQKVCVKSVKQRISPFSDNSCYIPIHDEDDVFTCLLSPSRGEHRRSKAVDLSSVYEVKD